MSCPPLLMRSHISKSSLCFFGTPAIHPSPMRGCIFTAIIFSRARPFLKRVNSLETLLGRYWDIGVRGGRVVAVGFRTALMGDFYSATLVLFATYFLSLRLYFVLYLEWKRRQENIARVAYTHTIHICVYRQTQCIPPCAPPSLSPHLTYVFIDIVVLWLLQYLFETST